MDYQVNYQSQRLPLSGFFYISANSDDDAVSKLRSQMGRGLCAEAWHAITLQDGREYRVMYKNGDLLCEYKATTLRRSRQN